MKLLLFILMWVGIFLVPIMVLIYFYNHPITTIHQLDEKEEEDEEDEDDDEEEEGEDTGEFTQEELDYWYINHYYKDEDDDNNGVTPWSTGLFGDCEEPNSHKNER